MSEARDFKFGTLVDYGRP